MVSSKELVKHTLEFNHTGRVPRHMWTLPWTEMYHPRELKTINGRFPDDITWCPVELKDPPPTTGDPYAIGVYIDEWGCIFNNRQRGVIGEVKEPLVKTWDDLYKVKPPFGNLSVDIEQANAFCQNTELFVVSSAGVRPFERLQFLRGTEELLIDLALKPAELHTLVDRVHQFFLKELGIWAKTDIDALFFQDDWGSQTNLLISPKTWREIFKPLYKEYIDLAHQHGKFAFMHSDGNIEKIYPDLIELGLDAINSQLFCMDIEELGQKCGGKITFWGEIDRQHTLPFGSLDEVEQAVRRVNEHLYHYGGVIAQCSFGVGVKPANVEQVFTSWEELHGEN
jgi:uroporphyrinogen decarboxylase